MGELLDRQGVLAYVLLLPGLLILTAFIGWPFVTSLWLSVTDQSVSTSVVRFVGLENFTDELRSQIFLQTLRNTFVYTGVTVVFKLAFGLGLAVLMNQSFRLKNLARAALLLPWIVPTALSAIAWLWLFDATFSVFNWAIVRSGLADRGINWLGEGQWAMTSIIIANIWRGTPFFAISILAGLQTVDRELLDAAAVDGASLWQRFWRITIPLIRPVLLIVLLFSTVQTISDFQLVYVLTRGGPANSTHLLGTLAYDVAVRAGQLSQGAAISLYMFPVLIVCVVALLVYMRRSST
ncbi:MAG: sugar ABC transporter permease [Chloroflexi bacterium]|nr:MAG: sugar ABC transporter permease [Chloroflexota bacterium]TMG39505.1 MAG: sugar ABC transporter permease [Chloroflexota bacterium]